MPTSRCMSSCWRHSGHGHACHCDTFPKAVCSLQVLVGSWFEPLQHLRGQLAGIVSNPPYIPAGNLPTLQVLEALAQHTCISAHSCSRHPTGN